MNALARRAVSVVAACLLFAVVLPGVEAQPPPPVPDTSGCTWDDLFPVLDWVGKCVVLEWSYFGDVVNWLRCDILGGAAC